MLLNQLDANVWTNYALCLVQQHQPTNNLFYLVLNKDQETGRKDGRLELNAKLSYL